jgi:hypothetical protein
MHSLIAPAPSSVAPVPLSSPNRFNIMPASMEAPEEDLKKMMANK